jgi:hypothetical protein
MKKNFVFLAMLAMVLAFGLAVVGCSDDPDNGGDNNNGGGGGVTVPADLHGVWKYTFANGTARTITFSANTYVYEQLIPTLTSGGVQYTNVKLKLTFTVTANAPVTNTDNATDRAEFPSGYKLTIKLTDIENSHPNLQTNAPTTGDIGYVSTDSFYINAAKDKFFGGYGQMVAYIKQEV